MKVTVLGGFGPGQLADSIAHGLEVLGHDVSRISDRGLVPGGRFRRLIARRRPELMRWPRIWQRQTELAESVIATSPQLVLAIKSPYLQARVIDRIRMRSSARMINWYPDNPFVAYGQRTPLSTLRHFDGMVVFSPLLAERVKKTLAVDAHYIPFGFDPRYYFPAPLPRSIKTDVAFVGQHRPERETLVRTLLEAGFSVRVAGPGWAAAARPVRSCWQPGPTWGTDAARLYQEARVGLNDLHAKSNAHSHNMRSWEIPATGTPMVTTESKHQRELLASVPSVSYYRNSKDLPAAVDRLIKSSSQEREPVDLSAHTYTERCRSLVASL